MRTHIRVIALALNTAPFKEMLQRWPAVGNTMSDLTGLRFEPQTSRYGDERVSARPTGRLCFTNLSQLFHYYYVKLIDRINAPLIFYRGKFVFRKIEGQTTQKIQLVFKHLLY